MHDISRIQVDKILTAKKIASTKERILKFIDYKGISKQDLFRLTGLKRGFLDADKLNTSIPDTFIATIVAVFPEVSLEWLITGEGKMLKEKVSIQAEDEYKEKYYALSEKYNNLLKEEESKSQAVEKYKEKFYELLERYNMLLERLIRAKVSQTRGGGRKYIMERSNE